MTTDGATLAVMALMFGPFLVWMLVAWGRALAKCEEERRSKAVPASGAVSEPDNMAGPVASGRPPGDRQPEPESSAPGRPPGARPCRQGEAVKGPAKEPESGAPGASPKYLGNDFRAAYVLGFIKSDGAAGDMVRAARQCYGQAHVPYLGLHMGTSVRSSGPRSRSGRGNATAEGRPDRTGPYGVSVGETAA